MLRLLTSRVGGLSLGKILTLTPAANDNAGPLRKIVERAGHQFVLGPDLLGVPRDQKLVAQLKQLIPGISGVVLGGAPFTREVIEAADSLKVISRAGVGYDAVDLVSARERGVVVVVAAGSNHVTVAEYAFGLITVLARQILTQHLNVKQGRWKRELNGDLEGKTLGIAGLGRIGQALASRALAFDMKVIACETFPNMDFVRSRGIELVDIDELCRRSDFISLHLPASPETVDIINARRLALMKPSAYIINTARGSLIDERALLRSLKDGQIAGAGLDVFASEPPAGSPLLELPNVVLGPHGAGVSRESMERMAIMATENALAVLSGVWPREIVVNGVYAGGPEPGA